MIDNQNNQDNKNNPPTITNLDSKPIQIYQQDITPGAVTQPALVAGGNQKGDLYYGMDGIRFSRLAIGTNNQFLTVSSGVPKWSTLATCLAYDTSTQTFTTGVPANITFNSNTYDPSSLHSTTTNTERILIPYPGIYLVTAFFRWNDNATGYRILDLYNKAGTLIFQSIGSLDSGGRCSHLVSIHYYSTVANDYIYLQAVQASGGNLTGIPGYNPLFNLSLVLKT